MPSFFSATSALLLVFCLGTAMMAQRPSTPYGTNEPVGYGQHAQYQRNNVDQNENDPGLS